MYRLRFSMLLGAAGIGLVCGCCSLSQCPLFSRLRGSSAADCCDIGAIPDGEASSGPVILPPGGPAGVPPNGIPQAAPQPRLEPVPQSTRTPYYPSARSGASRALEPLGDLQK